MSDRFAQSLLKSALKTGHLKLATPETDDESWQINDLMTEVNKSRCDKSALCYALLFDKVILNDVRVGGQLFRDFNETPNEDCLPKSRNLIQTISAEFNQYIQITNSVTNQGGRLFGMDEKTKANMYSLCEPLIWRSWKRDDIKNNTRHILRDVLDYIVLRPDMADKICGLHYPFNCDKWKSALEPLSWKYKMNRNNIEYFLSAIYIICAKGSVAVEKVLEAQAHDAVYPVEGLTFGDNRIHTVGKSMLGTVKHEDVLASIRVFIDQIKYFPIMKNFDDLVRLKEHKDFNTFRSFLIRWIQAFTSGDSQEEQRIRKELGIANHSLKRSAQCESIGRFFVYVAVPLVILDAVVGPFFGTSLTLASFGIQAYSDWIKSKNKWILIGQKSE